MAKRAFGAAAVLAALVAGEAAAFPLGFSVNGGIDIAYYEMEELDKHIAMIGQERDLEIDDFGPGVNFRVEGRIWAGGIVALAGGYQHFWGESEEKTDESSLSFHAPSDVYHAGIVVALLRVPNGVDLCLAGNYCWAKTAYGTNEYVERRLTEYKGEDTGYEAYAEVHTNNLAPIEVGLQFGYRWLNVEHLDDKFGERGYFDEDTPIEIDYSGFFFYLTTAIRIN